MICTKTGEMSTVLYMISLLLMVILSTFCATMGKAYYKYLMKGSIIETSADGVYNLHWYKRWRKSRPGT